MTDRKGRFDPTTHPLTDSEAIVRHIDIGTIENAHTLLRFMGTRMAGKQFRNNLTATLSMHSTVPELHARGVPSALTSAVIRLEDLMEHYRDPPEQKHRSSQWLNGSLVPAAVLSARSDAQQRSR